MGVTIRQIAERAGVSRGTVDRALNNRGRIRPEVAERIRQIAEEMGYQPNPLGRALVMSKNNLKIGVVIQAAETPFMQVVLQGIEGAKAEVEALGLTVLVYKIFQVSLEETIEALKDMREKGVSAIALMPAEDDRLRALVDQYVGEYGIPIVTFNSDLEHTKRLCFVGQNAVQCGRTAAGLMGEIIGGKGKVAVISGHVSNISLSNRVKGFCSEIGKKYPGIELLEPAYCNEKEERAKKITEDILKSHPDLTAIYMTSYGEAGICEALKAYQKAQDVKMIASDFMGRNYEFLRDGSINLLIGQDAYVQGYEPVMILYRLLYTGEKPVKEYVYTEIVIKTSYNIDLQ